MVAVDILQHKYLTRPVCLCIVVYLCLCISFWEDVFDTAYKQCENTLEKLKVLNCLSSLTIDIYAATYLESLSALRSCAPLIILVY